MTMLDRMRRHKNWLKWSLILVCLAFVVFYIPDFLAPPTTDLAATDSVAVVGGQEISATEFRNAYVSQMNAYRAAGTGLSERLLRQLGIDQQVLQQMVDERAALIEAERLGIRATDAEVRQRILMLPALQENGMFIGEERYVRLLAAQNPPITPAEFEESVRRALAIDKLRAAVTDWISISNDEVEREFRRQSERVRLALVPLPADMFRPDVSATDEEVAAHYEANREAFRVGERRKIRYVHVDVEQLREKIVIPEVDIERAYNENFDEYSEPDQIRASHILLRFEGNERDAVRSRAEEILKQAREGADFATLAREHSQDQGSAANGGDLDFFGPGVMVPEFEAAAFELEEGEISDLVETDFGFHIIKLTGRRPGTTRSIDEVREELTEQLRMERARDQAGELADRFGEEITSPQTLESVAAATGYEVVESDFFDRDDPIGALGPAPDVNARAFEVPVGGMTGLVPTASGFLVATVIDRRDPYLPALDEIRDQVRDALLQQKAFDVARQRAAALAPRLKTASNFEAAAAAAGIRAENTELLTRDVELPGLGAAPEVFEAAFAMDVNAVSDPIETSSGLAIVKVLEKDEVTEEELSENLSAFREQLLADRRSRFFSAYMGKVKQDLRIEVNREALRLIVG